MRLRVLRASSAGGIERVAVYGRAAGLTPVALEALVRELGITRTGTIDVRYEQPGRWIVRTGGGLSSGALEQRVRNVLFAR